jgi:hypothetical protein
MLLQGRHLPERDDMSCPKRDFLESNCTKWGCEERAVGSMGELRGVTSSDDPVLVDGARRPVSVFELSSPAAGPPLFAPRRADERRPRGHQDRAGHEQHTAIVRLHPGYEPGRPMAA